MTEDGGKVKLEWRKWVTPVHLALCTLINLRAVGQGLRLSHGNGQHTADSPDLHGCTELRCLRKG